MSTGVASARLALVLFVTGCIPIPAGLPPARASVGIGAAVGNPIPADDGTPLTDAEPVVVGQVGVTPQAMWAEQHRRPVEVEAGYRFQVFTEELRHNRNRHGAYLGLNVLLGDFWLGGHWRGRVVVRGSADYLVMQAHPGDGGGASWGLGFEAASFVAEASDTVAPPLLGAAAGEYGIGGELFGSAQSLGGYVYGTVGVAITGRWPGVAGIVMIPLSGSF